ncbi:MAG: cysteine peptidase family C39 domain-containing protein [Bdellovibrionales bacterium]
MYRHFFIPSYKQQGARSRLRRIRQRSPSDCGVCCVAMLLAVSYEEAFALCAPYMNTPHHDIDFAKLPLLFKAAGCRTHLEESKRSGWPTGNGLCEISYAQDGQQRWHYVVWDSTRGVFIDPQDYPPLRFSQHRVLVVDTGFVSLREMTEKRRLSTARGRG